MKSLLQINNRIQELEKPEDKVMNTLLQSSLFGTPTKPTKEEKKAAKELKNLIWCRNYLESSPSYEFVNSEHKRLLQSVKNRMAGFKDWLGYHKSEFDTEKEALAKYKKEVGITEINRQIKNLKFILE